MSRGSVAAAGLTEALDELAAATAGEAAALKAVAEAVNAGPLADKLEGKDLTVFIDGFNPAAVAEAVDAAENALAALQANLAADRADLGTNDIFASPTLDLLVNGRALSDARLNAVLAKAEELLNAELAKNDPESEDYSAAAEALAALQAAEKDLADDVKANGTNTKLLTDLKAALQAAVLAGDINASDNFADGLSVRDVLDLIDEALDPEDDLTADEALEQIAGLTPVETVTGVEAINSVFLLIVARQELIDDLDPEVEGSAAALYEAVPVVSDFLIAKELVEARNELKDDIAEMADYLAALTDLAAAYDVAVQRLADAEAALEDEGFELPVFLVDDGDSEAGEGNDIFMITLLEGGDVASISFFGQEGEDFLYFGTSAYTLIQLADDVETVAGRSVGSASTLEIFWQQVENDLVLFVETQAFGGSSFATTEIVEITLVGFSAEDITSFSGGFLTAGTAAA